MYSYMNKSKLNWITLFNDKKLQAFFKSWLITIWQIKINTHIKKFESRYFRSIIFILMLKKSMTAGLMCH